MTKFNPCEMDSDELVEIISLSSRELARRIPAAPDGAHATDTHGSRSSSDDVSGSLESVHRKLELARRVVDDERLQAQLNEIYSEIKRIDTTERPEILGDEIESALFCVDDLQDLKKRVPLISTPEDWNAANDSLQHLRKELNGFTIRVLVDRLIEELKSNWPSVAPDRQVFDPKRGQALERAQHYRCKKNNKPMVLRVSKEKGTPFWGCSEFPTCCYSRRWLTKEESNYLFGKSDDLPG